MDCETSINTHFKYYPKYFSLSLFFTIKLYNRMLHQYDKPLLEGGLQKAFKSRQVLTAVSYHKQGGVTEHQSQPKNKI